MDVLIPSHCSPRLIVWCETLAIDLHSLDILNVLIIKWYGEGGYNKNRTTRLEVPSVLPKGLLPHTSPQSGGLVWGKPW